MSGFIGGPGAAAMTGAEVKAAYEAMPDTNGFTDAEKATVARRSYVDPRDHGAAVDGVTDDTAALVAALAAASAEKPVGIPATGALMRVTAEIAVDKPVFAVAPGAGLYLDAAAQSLAQVNAGGSLTGLILDARGLATTYVVEAHSGDLISNKITGDGRLALTGDLAGDQAAIAAAGSGFTLNGGLVGVDLRDGYNGRIARNEIWNIGTAVRSVRDARDVHIDDNHLHHWAVRAVYIGDNSAVIYPYGHHVTRNLIETPLAGGASRYPIYVKSLSGGFVSEIEIAGNRIIGPGIPYVTSNVGTASDTNAMADMIELHGVRNSTVSGNFCKGGGEAGIVVSQGCQGILVTGNTVIDVDTGAFSAGPQGARNRRISFVGNMAINPSLDRNDEHNAQPAFWASATDDVQFHGNMALSPSGSCDMSAGFYIDPDVTGLSFDFGQLVQGAEDQNFDIGTSGPFGRDFYADVLSTGVLSSGLGAPVVTKTGTGEYTIAFQSDVTFVLASEVYSASRKVLSQTVTGNEVAIVIANTSDVPTDGAFKIIAKG